MTDTHSLQWYAISARGPVRSVNEDSVQFHPDDHMLAERPGFIPAEGQLCVVADGMGGLHGGKQASNMAVKHIIRAYYMQQGSSPEQAIREAIQQAHYAIIQVMRHNPDLGRMGTTVVLAATRGRQTWIANVGDSRAYLWRNRKLTILSEDDRWVTAQVREHILTEEQARHHEYRNLLNQHLGSDKELAPHLQSLQLQPEDRLLLCTDGLFDFVSDQEISRILAHSPDKAVRRLLKLALDRGSTDNITVAIGYSRPMRKSSHGFIYNLASRLGLVLLVLVLVFLIFLVLFPALTQLVASSTGSAQHRPEERQQVAALAQAEPDASPTRSSSTATPSPVLTATAAPIPTEAPVPAVTDMGTTVPFPRIEIRHLQNGSGLSDEERIPYTDCVKERDSFEQRTYLVFSRDPRYGQPDKAIHIEGLSYLLTLPADKNVRTECHPDMPPPTGMRLSGSDIERKYPFEVDSIYLVRYTEAPIRVFATDEQTQKHPTTRAEQQAAYSCPDTSKGIDDALVIFSAPRGTTAEFNEDRALHLAGNEVARCEKLDRRFRTARVIGQSGAPDEPPVQLALQPQKLHLVRYWPDQQPPH